MRAGEIFEEQMLLKRRKIVLVAAVSYRKLFREAIYNRNSRAVVEHFRQRSTLFMCMLVSISMKLGQMWTPRLVEADEVWRLYHRFFLYYFN